MEYIMNLENPSQERELERTERLFEIETEYMASQGFFRNADARRLRQTAVYNFKLLSETPGFEYDPFVPFLALTYFDRCISRHPIPDLEFLTTFVFSCTVLAWKLRSGDFSVRLLLERNGFEDEVEDITRMEQRILDSLDWKMISITAVCFLDFFMSLIHDNDPHQILTVKPKSILKHVLSMHYDAEFTQFKPSIIAAVGIIAERTENGAVGHDLCDVILRCKFVDTDEFENCLDLVKSNRAVDIIAALIPRFDFPKSLRPTLQEEEEEEEEEEAEIANAAVTPQLDELASPAASASARRGRGGGKRRREIDSGTEHQGNEKKF